MFPTSEAFLNMSFSHFILREVNPSIGSEKSPNSDIARSEIFTFFVDFAIAFAHPKKFFTVPNDSSPKHSKSNFEAFNGEINPLTVPSVSRSVSLAKAQVSLYLSAINFLSLISFISRSHLIATAIYFPEVSSL